MFPALFAGNWCLTVWLNNSSPKCCGLPGRITRGAALPLYEF